MSKNDDRKSENEPLPGWSRVGVAALAGGNPMTHEQDIERVAVAISMKCREVTEGGWEPSIAQSMAIARAARAAMPGVKVKPLEWVDCGDGSIEAGDFRIYDLKHPRRQIWRLVQAGFPDVYLGDFGGKDCLKHAKECAEVLHVRRILSAIEGATQ